MLVVTVKFSKKSVCSSRQADLHVPLAGESYANFLQNMGRVTREAIVIELVSVMCTWKRFVSK